MIDDVKYLGDGEFVISLDTLLDLLEARITLLRTDGSVVGDAINRILTVQDVTAYAVADSIIADIMEGKKVNLE